MSTTLRLLAGFRSAPVALALWLVALAITAATLFITATLPAAVPEAARQPHQIILLGVVVTGASVGAFLAWRRPRNPIGWLLCCAGATFGSAALLYFAVLHAAYSGPAPPALLALAATLGNLAWPLGIGLVAVYVPLYFPDGRLPSGRWRAVPWVLACAIFVNAAADATDPHGLDIPGRHIPNPVGLQNLHQLLQPVGAAAGLVLVGGLVASILSAVVRYRRGTDELRHQLKWFVAAVAFMVLSLLLSLFNSSSPIPGLLMAISMTLLPAAIAVAVLRYRLYDIDVVINKALVYGALAVFIGAVYVAVVAGVGALFGAGARPNLALSIAATAVVAVAFQPVRVRLQRLANRLVYGERATPYEVMANFSRQMAESFSMEDVLPRTAEAAGRSVNASSSRAIVYLPGGERREASWPPGADAPAQLCLPVSERGEVVGEIRIAKPTGDAISSAEKAVVEQLAAQSGVVFSNLRLTLELERRLAEITVLAQELQESRQRIVTAADAERQKLEANLREGAERELLAISEGIDQAATLLRTRPAQGRDELQALTERAHRTLDGLRELARGIFPPLLAEKGLVAALESHLRRFAEMRLEVAPRLSGERFDPHVEAALYFACASAVRGLPAAQIHLEDADGSVICRIRSFERDALLDIRDRVEAAGGTVSMEGDELVVRVQVRALDLVG